MTSYKTVHEWSRDEIIALLKADAVAKGIVVDRLDEFNFVRDGRSVTAARLYSVRPLRTAP